MPPPYPLHSPIPVIDFAPSLPSLLNLPHLITLKSNPGCLLQSPNWLESTIEKVEPVLGIPRNSPRFGDGIELAVSMAKSTLETKFEVFTSFGCPDSEIHTMVRALPFTSFELFPQPNVVADTIPQKYFHLKIYSIPLISRKIVVTYRLKNNQTHPAPCSTTTVASLLPHHPSI